MRHTLKSLLKMTLAVGCLTATAAHSQEKQSASVLFENVRIFDGKGNTLSAASNVLVLGNKIVRISPAAIPVDRRADTRVIQGGGRTLMPGLIDAHWHTIYARDSPANPVERRHGLRPSRRRQGGRRNADAGLHQRSRRRWPSLRPQAGHRPGRRRRPPHLALWSDDFADRWARRFPNAP